jgi:Domain of unknown function (DUF4189)
MRWAMLAAAAVALVLLAASPARAGYGAFALDTVAHKFGYSDNQADQRHADRLALEKCKSSGCKIVFRVPPRKCGALAASGTSTAWGGAARPTGAAAREAALRDCEKRTSGHCRLLHAVCNR